MFWWIAYALIGIFTFSMTLAYAGRCRKWVHWIRLVSEAALWPIVWTVALGAVVGERMKKADKK